MKKNAVKSYVDIVRSQRKDWGSINPVTKIIPDKRKKKPKYKYKEVE